MTNFIPGIFFPGVPLILVVENLSFLRGVGAKATVRRGVRGTPFEKLIRGYDGPAKSNIQHQLPLCILCSKFTSYLLGPLLYPFWLSRLSAFLTFSSSESEKTWLGLLYGMLGICDGFEDGVKCSESNYEEGDLLILINPVNLMTILRIQ